MKNELMEVNKNDAIWNTLKNSIYPGASDDSITMVLEYCKAAKLDPMTKPVHIVPFKGKDVIMPGIGFQRIVAARSGLYAGMTEPEYGPVIQGTFGDKIVEYPEWCKITVKRIVGEKIVGFTAKEYWKENYATAYNSSAPNSMWAKRPFGQLAKCCEAQALRKAFPDLLGAAPTSEEMEGKGFDEAPVEFKGKYVEPIEVEDKYVIDGNILTDMELTDMLEAKIQDIFSKADLDNYEAWKEKNRVSITRFCRKNMEVCKKYADHIGIKKMEFGDK